MGKYHSDKPITEKQADLFNRSSFVEDLVEELLGLDRGESFVVGLFAEWGAGKTSVINLVKQRLKGKDVYFAYVSAWMLNGDFASIIYKAFSITSEEIKGRKIIPLRRWATNVRNFFSESETSIEGVSLIDVSRILIPEESAKKNRKKIVKALKKAKSNKKRLIIFIDDIDRLDSARIVNLFRELSTIKDQPGITYVLPFDKNFVSSAIGDFLPTKQNGAAYLEKIIQIPLHLPAVPRYKIDDVFRSKLGELLDEFSINISEGEVSRFFSLYASYGANDYLRTPRDINKAINALRFALPRNHDEVNIVDTIILEIIGVFDEALYDKIRQSKEVLIKTGSSLYGRYLSDEDDKKRLCIPLKYHHYK